MNFSGKQHHIRLLNGTRHPPYMYSVLIYVQYTSYTYIWKVYMYRYMYRYMGVR